MAAGYQSFTSTRPTEPDLTALLTQLRTQDPTIGIRHVLGTPTYVLKKNTDWTAPQITGAQNAIDTAPEADEVKDALRLKLARALVAYIWRTQHAGVNPTLAQLNGELAIVETIYRALP